MFATVAGSVTTASRGRAVSPRRFRITRYWPKPVENTTSTPIHSAWALAWAVFAWRSW
jgi:hypothetical protein